jgi:hypothetical protein
MTDPAIVSAEAFASIHGLFVRDELPSGEVLVELDPTVHLVQLDAETERLMYQTETIRRVGRIRWSDRHFAVRILFDLPPEGDARQRTQERINRLMQDVLDCFRLYQAGRIYYGGIIHRAISREGAIDLFHRAWSENPAGVYPLTDQASVDGLARLWSTMRSRAVRDRQFLTLARRWFSGSAEASRVEDRIISLMTAAEALFQAGAITSRKGEHIADAAGDLGLATVDGGDLRQHLLDSYALRNEILHEGHMGRWRPKGAQRLSPSELSKFVEVTSNYMRAAIREVLTRTTAPPKPTEHVG